MSTRVYPTGTGKNVVEFECEVSATPLAASTSIDTCSVGGHKALLVPFTLPGSQAVAVGAVILDAGRYTLCVSGHSEFIKGGNPGPVGDCKAAIELDLL
jgi:hypothetical protein